MPEKSLLAPLKKTGGRNVNGRRTMRYIGGGHKKMYRVIDFQRTKDGVAAKVTSIEYDPNRSPRWPWGIPWSAGKGRTSSPAMPFP